LTAVLIQSSTTTAPGYSTSSTGKVNGTVKYNQAITPDPLATWATTHTPSTSGMLDFGSVSISTISFSNLGAAYNKLMNNGVQYGKVTGSAQITLFPGNYSGDLNINHTTNDGAVITLQTGVYYFGGNVSLNGYGTVKSGNGGTMLYLANGAFSNSSSHVAMSVSPMTSGTYSNPAIAIWQDGNNQNQFNSSNGGNLNISSGIFYAPNVNTQVQLNSKSGSTVTLGSEVICGSLQLGGSGGYSVNVGQSSAPGRNLYLVE
jgi:hypothetical protein